VEPLVAVLVLPPRNIPLAQSKQIPKLYHPNRQSSSQPTVSTPKAEPVFQLRRPSPYIQTPAMASKEPPKEKDKDKSKVHKLSLKGSAKLVAEFVSLPPSSAVFLHVAFSNQDLSVPILHSHYSVRAI
jgi:hypothetical protein